MKKYLLVVVLIACLSSCKKEQNPAIPSVNGTWELRAQYGGWAQPLYIASGKGIRYQFTINNRYTKTDSNKVETSGNFSIKFTNENNGYKFGTITFTNPDYTDAISFKADTIIIGNSAADGPSYQYVRIKK